MRSCGHDGWRAGCPVCERSSSLTARSCSREEGRPALEERLSEVMNRFPEVEWDRWAVHDGFGAAFGWVDPLPEAAAARAELVEQARLASAESLEAAAALGDDAPWLRTAMSAVAKLASVIETLPVRRDFLSLTVSEGRVDGFSTSSAALSEEFGRRLGLDGSHEPCRRVEDDLPLVRRAARRRRGA